jgi:predicted ATPase/DNA-binding winged helix-turn-helix (wHTH) protein
MLDHPRLWEASGDHPRPEGTQMMDGDSSPTKGSVSFGPFRLTAEERLLEKAGAPLQLGGRALDLLIALVDRAGEVVTRNELISRVWPNVTVDETSLRVHVAGLRKALGDGIAGARYVTNVPGRGYCFVAPISRSDAPKRLPGLEATKSDQAHRLPARLMRMIGRDETVGAISAELAARRFITIVGPGGLGKTTVAVSVGHALLREFDGAVSFVDLGSISDPLLVPSQLATALGLLAQSDNLIPGLIAFLRDKRMLLILDGCEHVIGTAATLAEVIFEQTEEIHVLATSREALRIEGEHVHRLAPLECPPGTDTLTAAESLAFPAARLFSDRASANSDRFVLRDDNAPIVARICRKLDGIALAIELAASRVDAHGVEGVEAMLDSKLSLLWHGRRTAPPRHQTLNAAIEWSYELLADAERSALWSLAVFAGPFSMEAAQAVAREHSAETDEIAEVIANLVTKSLIASESQGGSGVRYRLLDTTRTYLQAKLSGAAEAHIVARRHAEYLRTLLERIGAQGPAFAEARGFGAHAEHVSNVRVALEWSFSEHGDAGLGIALAAAAAPLFLEMSLLAECRRWTEKALTAHAEVEGDPRSEMELQAAFGLSRLFTEGNSPPALDTLKRALELAEAIGEFGPQLRLIGSVHLFYTRIADFRGSVEIAQQALAVATKMGDPAALAVAEWAMGSSRHLFGDQAMAVIHCQSAVPRQDVSMRVDVMRSGFDHRIRGLVTLARAQWLSGAVDEAADMARYSVSEAEALEHPVTVCISLIYAVSVLLWRGDWPDAEALIERLIADTAKYSLGPYHAVGLAMRGELAVRRGDAEAAIPVLSGPLQTMRSGRHDVLTSAFTRALAEAMAMTGRLDEALTTIKGAISDADRRGGSYDVPEMLRLEGSFLVSGDSSNVAAAEDCFRRSLELARRQGALSWELRTVTAMARLWASQGRREAAREVLASVLARFGQGMETIDLRAAGILLDAVT